MPRLTHACRVVAIVLAATAGAGAQDLGRLVERAAENRLRQAVSPRNLERAFAPSHAEPGEPVVTRSADGWMLVAQHFKPTGPPQPRGLPVILCHGLTYNALFWDLDDSCSLAQYLARFGFDVWAVNLRGCGLSQKWVWKLDDAPAALIGTALRRLNHGKLGATGYATLDPRFANWTLDHHIAYDVPAFVNLVRRRTGASEVAWVGHSMGGIVALACLARYQNPGIGRLVTVGSQLTMPKGEVAERFLSELLARRQQQLSGQWSGDALLTQTKTSVHNLFFNEQNVSPKVYEALSGWATDVPAIGLMEQYLTLSRQGVLLDARGRFNYAKGAGNIKVPILITCGEVDNFAPPPVQKFLYDHVGSTDKTLYIFGKSQGLNVDAGHDDTLVGLHAKGQTYPVIARWLASHPRTP